MRTSIGVAVAIVGIGIVAVVAIVLSGGKELRYKTQAALLGALPKIATAELEARGHPLTTPLSCWKMRGSTDRSMRVSCSGTTAKRQQVMVIGSAEDQVKEQYYTILVDGRPLVQNVHCLGADCRPAKN